MIMYKRAALPFANTASNWHNKIAPYAALAGMVGSYAQQVQTYAPIVQTGAMIIDEEKKYQERQRAKKLRQQQLAQQQSAAGQQQGIAQQQDPTQGYMQQPQQQFQQPMQQQMSLKQAAIRNRLMLINACNYILTVKQAKAYGIPAARLLREKRAYIKKQAFIPYLGGVTLGYAGAKLGNSAGNWLASKMGLSDDSWGARALRWGGGALGAVGGFLGGTSLDAFTGGMGGGAVGFLTNMGASVGAEMTAGAAGNGLNSAADANKAKSTIANMKAQTNNNSGQTSFGQTSYGTA